jgi:DNA-binding winged helix-turn-helix (wHTH) protein/Tol biopolymer transport system component
METKDVLDFGPFRADLRTRTLTKNGEVVSIPAKAFDVLQALLRKPGQTILKNDLVNEVWPGTFVEEGNLTQMIFLLRKALGEAADGQALIVTIPRQGYRFAGALASAPPIPPPSTDGAPWIHRNSAHLTSLLVAILAGLLGWAFGRTSGSPAAERVIRYSISPPDGSSFRDGKMSPDGRSVALMSVDRQGRGQLLVRRLDSLETRPLAAAEFWPFWSSDSRFIAFAADGKLKKIDLAGGPPQVICVTPLVIGGSWNTDGTIIFGDGTAIRQVSAGGGDAKPLTTLNSSRGESSHDFPVFLPDGRHFLYTAHSSRRENSGIFVASLDEPNVRTRLLEDISNVVVASGYLLFMRDASLMAQRFNTPHRKLEGDAFPVVDKLARNPGNLTASFSASEDGVLVVTSPDPGDQVTWLDRSGQRLGAVGKAGLHLYPQIAPDQQAVSFDEFDPERFISDIWLVSSKSAAASRLTFNGSIRALWSPSSDRLAFESPTNAIAVKTAAGAESESEILGPLNRLDNERLPCEWSKDGRFLLYAERATETGYDLWILRLTGDRHPIPLLHTKSNEWCGSLSADGKWIAYESDESGKSEIYVQAFLERDIGSGRKWQVSANGGHWPKWRGDGKEILYLTNDRVIAGVNVTTAATFTHSAPHALFPSEIRTPDARFDVTEDGQRFLVPSAVTSPLVEPAAVRINWLK